MLNVKKYGEILETALFSAVSTFHRLLGLGQGEPSGTRALQSRVSCPQCNSYWSSTQAETEYWQEPVCSAVLHIEKSEHTLHITFQKTQLKKTRTLTMPVCAITMD